MYANVLNSYGHLDWREVDEPRMSSDDVMIKVGVASICGTDQHIYHGHFHPRTQLPLIPGHEFAGTIVEVGKEIKQFAIGDRVAVDPIIWCGNCPACRIGHFPACTALRLLGIDMDGGFAQYVAAKPHMLFKLPENISDRHGALVEVLAIGFHACKRAGVQAGDSVAIWGTGKVGHCVLQAAKTKTDGPVFLIDIIQDRLDLAKRIYPDVHIINAMEIDPISAIKEITDGNGVDVAFEVAGHDASGGKVINPVRGCINIIRGAGKVVVLGLGDEPAPVVFKELIWKEAQIIASRVTHGEFAEVIDQMAQGKLHPEALITKTLAMSEADVAFGMLDQAPGEHLKVLLELAT